MIYLDYSIAGKSIIGRQIDSLIALSFRDRVIINPNLILEINSGSLFSNFEEAIFLFIVTFAAIKEDLGLNINLSSIDT